MTFLLLLPAAFLQSDPLPGTGWQAYFQTVVEDYVVETRESKRVAAALRKAPVLRWNQPVRGGDDGAVYVWLREGRPAVIGTFFAWPTADGRRGIAHELHSLDTLPLEVTWKDRILWTPEKAGVTFQTLNEAPVPAKTPSQRLAQMRSLARRFSARSIDKNDKDWELRLLSQPLYRYEVEKPAEALDGAVFALAQGTDPEILLLIEARKAGDGFAWQYAAGRFSDFRLRLSLDNTQVWSVEGSRQRDTKGPYFVTTVETLDKPPATEP